MRQLSVSQTISHMLASTFNNLRFAVFAQWPWMVIMAVLLVLLQVTSGSNLDASPNELEAYLKNNPGQAVSFVLVVIATFLVGFLGFASAAVNWHRYILLDEIPQGMDKLRMDATVWRYLGNLLLIGLLGGLCILPPALVILISPGFGIMVFIAFAIFVLSPMIYRWSVKLPAVALGKTMSIQEAWQATEGNWWQFVGVGLLIAIISWVVGLIVLGITYVVYTVFGNQLGGIVDILVQLAVQWVLTIMGVTLLTSLYGFFVEKRDF
jgi:hypothetical protein